MMLAVLFLSALASPGPQEPAAPTPATVEDATPRATTAAAQPYIDAGISNFKKRRFAKAEAEFQKAVDADPGSAAAHFYLGYTKYKLVEKKRPFHPGKQEAAAEFAKAYQLDPGFQPVWHMKH